MPTVNAVRGRVQGPGISNCTTTLPSKVTFLAVVVNHVFLAVVLVALVWVLALEASSFRRGASG
jgi:hypothetical protein